MCGVATLELSIRKCQCKDVPHHLPEAVLSAYLWGQGMCWEAQGFFQALCSRIPHGSALGTPCSAGIEQMLGAHKESAFPSSVFWPLSCALCSPRFLKLAAGVHVRQRLTPLPHGTGVTPYNAKWDLGS